MSGATGGLSKAAKKNQKRHAKKRGVPVKGPRPAVTPESLLPELKAQLEEAKLAQDVERASQIREQIWVLNDLIKGVKTDMPASELVPIIAKIETLLVTKVTESEPTSAVSAEPAKRIRNLQKKLDQIEKLNVRKSSGETLEDGQIEKLKSEDELREEIKRLQAAIKTESL